MTENLFERARIEGSVQAALRHADDDPEQYEYMYKVSELTDESTERYNSDFIKDTDGNPVDASAIFDNTKTITEISNPDETDWVDAIWNGITQVKGKSIKYKPMLDLTSSYFKGYILNHFFYDDDIMKSLRNNFEKYIGLYLSASGEAKIRHEKINEFIEFTIDAMPDDLFIDWGVVSADDVTKYKKAIVSIVNCLSQNIPMANVDMGAMLYVGKQKVVNSESVTALVSSDSQDVNDCTDIETFEYLIKIADRKLKEKIAFAILFGAIPNSTYINNDYHEYPYNIVMPDDHNDDTYKYILSIITSLFDVGSEEVTAVCPLNYVKNGETFNIVGILDDRTDYNYEYGSDKSETQVDITEIMSPTIVSDIYMNYDEDINAVIYEILTQMRNKLISNYSFADCISSSTEMTMFLHPVIYAAMFKLYNDSNKPLFYNSNDLAKYLNVKAVYPVPPMVMFDTLNPFFGIAVDLKKYKLASVDGIKHDRYYDLDYAKNKALASESVCGLPCGQRMAMTFRLKKDRRSSIGSSDLLVQFLYMLKNYISTDTITGENILPTKDEASCN